MTMNGRLKQGVIALNRKRHACRHAVKALLQTPHQIETLAQSVDRLGRALGDLRNAGDAMRAGIDQQFREADAQLHALQHEIQRAQRQLDGVNGSLNYIAARRQPHAPFTVAFLVHNADAWASIADVVALMQAAPDFRPVVFSIDKKFPGQFAYSGESDISAFLTRQGIAHVRLPQTVANPIEILRSFSPDVVFRQSQWDADVPPHFGTANLAFSRLAYIPYEIVNQIDNPGATADILDNATDSIWHRNCWRVFVTTTLQRDQAYARGRLLAHNVRVTGHPKVARLAALQKTAGQRHRVVWSVHHSIRVGWNDFGLFHVIHPRMIRLAKDRPDITFVFSPHPALMTMLTGDCAPLTRAEVDAFFRDWNALPNTEMWLDPDYLSLIGSASALLSDSLSMPVEYLIADRPVFFVEREGHVPFNAIGDCLVIGYERSTSVEEMIAKLLDFVDNGTDMKSDARARVRQALFSQENAAQNIVDEIRTGLLSEIASAT